MTDLIALLDPERISCGCEIRSKKRALQTVAELLGPALRRDTDDAAGATGGNDESPVSDMAILDALINRERLGSTGIGHGIALPHARLAHVQEPMAALITLKEGVDFDAVDQEPVDVVIGLLVPEHCNDEHLKILADLARRFSDAGLRGAIRASDDAAELMSRLGETRAA